MSEIKIETENFIAEDLNFSENEIILKTTDLTKKYARKKAVDSVNIEIEKGSIYGFIGKNGAGKTTTIKMIVGLASPSAGKIELFGSKNLVKGCKKVGTVIESPAFCPYMTARQNIELQRILKGVNDKTITDELLELVDLKKAGRKKAKNFSLGMKQRLAIALALVGDPKFLILDEPINGLDPTGIKEVRELILKLNKEAGITVLISSHILGELNKMVTHYGVVNKGKIVAQFSAKELKEKVKPCIKIVVNNPERAIEVIKEKFGDIDVKFIDNTICVYEAIDNFVAMNSALEEAEIIVSSFVKEEGDYENYFIDLMEGEVING